MNNNSEPPQFAQKFQSFINQEEAVGISLQNFKQKFLFNQNSGPDAFYLDVNTPSPSQLIGMTRKQEDMCIYLMSQLLFKAGQILRLPISTTIVAINIAQYYYTRRSFLEYDLREICMGSMFLACKSEQTLRRSYQVSSSFDYLFKMYEGLRVIRHLELNSSEYNSIKEKVLKTENQLLFELGFEVYKLFDIPHRYISGLISSFNRHKNCNQIVQNSWIFLNDIYRTKASIYYPGQVIAASAVFMSLQKLQISFPDKPWWILMESSITQINEIIGMTNQMHKMTSQNQINLNKISQIHERIGKQALCIVNVFPVPYYRKLNLQNRGNFKKCLKNEQHGRLQGQNKQKQIQQNQRKISKHQNKNEERQINDQGIYEKRSRSRSQQRERKQEKRGKYQNDQDTPKIERISKTDNSPGRKLSNGQMADKYTLNELNTQSLNQLEYKKEETQKENNSITKTSVLNTKAMLSKISSQIKKIQVKNDISASLNIRAQGTTQPTHQQNRQVSESSSQEQELLAQLIQIKKKNLQKKEEKL